MWESWRPSWASCGLATRQPPEPGHASFDRLPQSSVASELQSPLSTAAGGVKARVPELAARSDDFEPMVPRRSACIEALARPARATRADPHRAFRRVAAAFCLFSSRTADAIVPYCGPLLIEQTATKPRASATRFRACAMSRPARDYCPAQRPQTESGTLRSRRGSFEHACTMQGPSRVGCYRGFRVSTLDGDRTGVTRVSSSCVTSDDTS